MLAAWASIDASLCGILRAFFGDFLSLLSGMKISVPLSTTVSTDLTDMIDLLRVMGAGRTSRLRPCPSARPGVASAGRLGRGGSPALVGREARAGLHKRVPEHSKIGKDEKRGRPGRRPKSAAALPPLHPGAREGGAP